MTTRKLLTLMGAGAVLATLAGCATSDHLYSNGRCMTCLNNPITGEPVNYDPDETPVIEGQAGATEHASTAVASGNMSGSFSVQSSLDVDMAFLRLRREFGFRTDDDVNLNHRNYTYNAVPGTYYEVGDGVSQVIGGTTKWVALTAYIERSGTGSQVQFRFSPSRDSQYPGAAMQEALQQRAESALR